ncbi:hypothetical protein ACFPYN_09725 [Paenisporosarcina macmurdoensis]|uniref:DUF3188 domain-containing protein n=1 Tax=Paenisporosarcina macmurdoensis TaxID=212659 RepID=A0ABW1L8Y9_9BACL
MKLNQNYLYIALFIGLFAILVGTDYNNQSEFNWTKNLLMSGVFIVLFILIMGSTLKKAINKKDSDSQ